MKSHFLLLPLLFILAACGGSKYPYAPQFVSPAEMSERTIGAPPVVDSAEYSAEIDHIIAEQQKLTPADIAEIKHEITIRPELMVQPVLGEQYTEADYPALYTLLKHAGSDAWRISDVTRDYWKAPRPWYADQRVKLYTERIYARGYPSGHTTTFGTWAHVLSDLVPEKREAFFEKAWSVGGNRMLGGAHFPYDIVGGKKLSMVVYDKMQDSPEFVREFNAAAAELKHPRRAKATQTGPRPHSHCCP